MSSTTSTSAPRQTPPITQFFDATHGDYITTLKRPQWFIKDNDANYGGYSYEQLSQKSTKNAWLCAICDAQLEQWHFSVMIRIPFNNVRVCEKCRAVHF